MNSRADIFAHQPGAGAGRLTFALLAALALLAVTAVSLAPVLRSLRADNGLVTRTLTILATAEALVSDLKDAETGQRGYLLTGDPAYLGPYESSLRSLEGRFRSLDELVADPAQAARLPRLKGLRDEKLGELERTIALHKAGRVEAALDAVRSGEGKWIMDEIRREADAFIAGERRLLEERAADAERSARLATWASILTALLAVLAVGLAARLALRRSAGRTQAAEGARDLAEGELRASEARNRSIVDTAVDAIAVIDERGTIQSFNPAAERIFGYAADEMIGRNVSLLMGDEHRGRHDGYVGAYRSTGVPKIIGIGREVEGRRRDGSRFPLDLSIAEWRADGQRYFTGVMRDVTERKRAETALRDLAATLERRVEERTGALEAANEELNAFAYTVSHDLRAPLRSMEGFADALVEDYGERLDEEGLDYAARIRAAARRMETLIEDILAYSRLGRQEVELRAVDLDRVVDAALADLGEDVAGPGARIEVTRPLGQVRANGPVLRQVVANLAANAAKFVRPGESPRVRIRAEERDGRVRLLVEDDGIGIEPRYFERIFAPFQRLHGAESYPGTGIGLAIVRRAVERMQGTCGVESEPGSGSRFWIELAASGPNGEA